MAGVGPGYCRIHLYSLGLSISAGKAPRLRVEYPGAIYHGTNRGDRREPIFQDDADRRTFLGTVAEACLGTSLGNGRR